MFASSNVPSLSDIAAVTRNGEDGFGGNNGWWILIILFALFGGWGNAGYGGFGGGSQGAAENYVLASDFATVQRQIDSASSEIRQGINSLGNGLSSLGYDQLSQMNGINTNIANSTNQLLSGQSNLGFQLQQCCCDNKALIADVKYTMATDTCAIKSAITDAQRNIIENDNANYRAIDARLTAMEMSRKDERIAELQAMLNEANRAASQCAQTADIVNQLRPAAVPAFQVPNPYAPYYSGCGANNGCCA